MTNFAYEPMRSPARSLIHGLVDLAIPDDTINCDAETLKRLRSDCHSTIVRLNYAIGGLGRLLAGESEGCQNPSLDDHFNLALSVAEIGGIVAELEMAKSALEIAKPGVGDGMPN